MSKNKAIKPWLRLTERAAAANYELTKESILLHERLLEMGGPYLTSKARLKLSFGTYEEPLKELASKGLVIIVGEELINPFYFTDTESPSSDFHYKKAPADSAARLFVSSDLIITKEGRGTGTLHAFQETIWGDKANRYKSEAGIKSAWASHCSGIEGRYREETRPKETRLEETKGNKTNLDKPILEETIETFIPFPSSNPSPIGIEEIDDEESLFEEEEAKPIPANPIAKEQELPNPLLFQHEWKMALYQRDKAKQARLIDTFERYPQETKEKVKGYLTEEEWEELNDSMPF